MTELARDNEAYRFPISVKGVVLRGDTVVLLHNSRGEWELPGGKLELTESPERCVEREIDEELQLSVEAHTLLDSWVYTVSPGVHVLIVTYGCVEIVERDAVLSHEHSRLQWFPLHALESVEMPDGYRSSIRRWVERMRG